MPNVQDLKKKEEFHLTSYSRWDNLDQYMNQGMIDRFGDLFLEYRENWKLSFKRTISPDYPLMIGIESTDSCNYRCKMCYRSKNPNTAERLGVDKIYSIIDDGAENNLPCIVFGGGADEPFMEKNLLDILEYATQKKIMDIILTSNGALITRDKIEQIVDLQVTRLQISLDASSQEAYGKIRGGVLEPIEEIIRYCYELKQQRRSIFPIIRLSFVIQDDNRHEMNSFLNKWKDIADKIDFQYLIDSDPDNLERDHCNKLFCAEPWQRVNIWADGTITPCCTFYSKHFKLGNIHVDTISETWKSPVIKKLRENLVSGNFPKPCINCTGDIS
jgi:radical SAM protein with 4Fe4S-binding SPASM domain